MPFVLSSAYCQLDENLGAAFDGAVNLGKPIDSDRLVRLIRRLLLPDE